LAGIGAQHQAMNTIELRQYTLRAGARDTLIELFEREFIETQEAAGIYMIGTFRDLDDRNRFVWLRGFADMPSRAAALAAFYDGPAWKAHREAANATMLDSDNVLLLRPTAACPRFVASAGMPGVVVGLIVPLDALPGAALVAHFEAELRHALAESDAQLIATLATEPAANNFARLPVREGESVLVGLARFAGAAALGEHLPRLQRLAGLPAPQLLRLAPTRRSRM